MPAAGFKTFMGDGFRPFFIAVDGRTGKDGNMKNRAQTIENGNKNRTRRGYIRYITEAAVIAAMYAALTIIIPGGSGQIQVRVAEALTVLPYFTPAAIPGLFAGCITSNIFVGAGMYDIIFGSLATLSAAFFTSKMPSKALAPLPPVIFNAVIVAFVLNATINAPLFLTMLTVGLGELVACYGLGYPLILFLEKNREKIFRRQ